MCFIMGNTFQLCKYQLQIISSQTIHVFVFGLCEVKIDMIFLFGQHCPISPRSPGLGSKIKGRQKAKKA